MAGSKMSKSNYYPETVIVIPTYNEADNLPKIVEEISSLGFNKIGFIIIDDGSPDGTGIIADKLSDKFQGFFKVIHRKSKMGLGTAYVEGFMCALENKAKNRRIEVVLIPKLDELFEIISN